MASDWRGKEGIKDEVGRSWRKFNVEGARSEGRRQDEGRRHESEGKNDDDDAGRDSVVCGNLNH